MYRKVSILHSQSDVTECVALTKCVHGIEDGFGMGVGHDVFGSHCTVLDKKFHKFQESQRAAISGKNRKARLNTVCRQSAKMTNYDTLHETSTTEVNSCLMCRQNAFFNFIFI